MAEIRHRTVRANGIQMHVAEAGAGVPVLMCHGWPELWYSWRHQLGALAAAGFRAIAPVCAPVTKIVAPARGVPTSAAVIVPVIVPTASCAASSRAPLPIDTATATPNAYHDARPDLPMPRARPRWSVRRHSRFPPI